MKRSIFTALLAGAALVAGAQTDKKMTQEEKEQAMQELEWMYRMDTGQTFKELAAMNGNDEREVTTLPWEKWKEEEKGNPEIALLFSAFEHPALEPVADRSDACRIWFRCQGPDNDDFSATGTTCTDSNFHTDEQGNRIGFHHQIPLLGNLEADFRFHLTTEDGQRMFLQKEGVPRYLKRQKRVSEGVAEYAFGLEFPLSSPYMYIDGGYVDVTIYAPDEYELVEIPIDQTGYTAWLNRLYFTLVKADTTGFVIQADEETMEKLDPMKYIYRRGDAYRTSSPVKMTGPLDKLLHLNDRPVPTFDEWLSQNGIDKEHLEETIGNFGKSDEDEEGGTDAYGQIFHTGMTGDALLLYMPSDSICRRPIATMRLFASALHKAPEVRVDRELTGELLARISADATPATARPTSNEPLRGAEQLAPDFLPEEQAEIHRRFRPLERPMVRYHIEDAIQEGDSCWTLLRITVPQGAIRKGERYTAQVVLHTPDGFMVLDTLRLDADGSGLFPTRPRAGKPVHFFLSNKFLYDPRMEHNADISIFPEIESRHYRYRYTPVMLLLGWGRGPHRWERTAGLGEREYLQTLPPRPADGATVTH